MALILGGVSSPCFASESPIIWRAGCSSGAYNLGAQSCLTSGGGGITQLTGGVVAGPGSGSVTATVTAVGTATAAQVQGVVNEIEGVQGSSGLVYANGSSIQTDSSISTDGSGDLLTNTITTNTIYSPNGWAIQAYGDGGLQFLFDAGENIIMDQLGNFVISSGAFSAGSGNYTIDTDGNVVTNGYINLASLTPNLALITNGSTNIATSLTTSTELGYVSGTTSNIQTQLNALLPKASPAFTGTISGPIFNPSATQTTVNGTTSGSVVFSQPLQGSSLKVVVIFINNLTGTASYTYPTAFSHQPGVVTMASPPVSAVSSLSSTAVTITGSSTNGFEVLMGY